jgi:hypothetical protein
MEKSHFKLGRLRNVATTFATLSLCLVACSQTTVRSYKSGIDIVLSGLKGKDWIIEQSYHDPKVFDGKVIYVRESTEFTFSHNESNSTSGANSFTIIGSNGQDALQNTGDEGIIRYRVDRDLHWGPLWVGEKANPAVDGLLSFNNLEYEPGVPIVGSTGPIPGIDITNKTEFYWRGYVGPQNNEWHTKTSLMMIVSLLKTRNFRLATASPLCLS